MINMEELKPIMEGLLEGREDAADYIEKIQALDKPVEVDRSEIDALNASWNDRFKAAFFGPKGDDLTGSPDETPAEGAPETEDGGMEDITIDDLFEEVKED